MIETTIVIFVAVILNFAKINEGYEYYAHNYWFCGW
jgi:hypothetical protein